MLSPPLGPDVLDDATRHAGVFTLPRLSLFARWMLTQSPECLRKNDQGYEAMADAAAERLLE
jgi:hypothetical protein